MFKRVFSVNGRIRRLEFFLTNLIYTVLSIFYFILIETYTYYGELDTSMIILSIAFIPFYWIMIAQSIKRSHDIGNSGWFILIPFYSVLLLLVNGDGYDNKYGENPKV